MISSKSYSATVVLLGIALWLGACAGTTPPPSIEPMPMPVEMGEEGPLPVDARITVGKLDNGLTYFVLPHQKPENRAQLWLVVNAGSVLEDDDQKGLAHFVEHMAFNGTENYPKQEIVNFIESVGMDFGADLNAYTSFDETVYMLQVPTDDEELLSKGLEILHEWAGRISFTEEEVEKERGVVLEEWRGGRGAYGRIRDKQYPILMYGSRYAERLPIGDPTIIETASRETILRFYEDWYRPELMAVVAVGDFEAASMEAAIRDQFADLSSKESPRDREIYYLPEHDETLVSADTDEELPSTSVSVVNKIPHRPESTRSHYRQGIVERLFSRMMGARFYEISETPDAPFLGAGTGFGGLTRTADQVGRSARAKEGRVLEALGVLVAETQRVQQHGFTQTELDRAKETYLRGIERAMLERDKTNAQAFSSEIVRHFLENEAMPGIETELEMTQEFLPTITLDEINELSRTTVGERNRVILVTGPAKTPLPEVSEIIAAVESSAGLLEAWKDDAPTGPLVEDEPEPGRIVKESGIPEVDVTEWTLSNGVRVVLKPTDFQNDSIGVSAWSPGGNSLVSDEEYRTTTFATTVVNESGLGSMGTVALRKALNGKVAGVRPYISSIEEGFWGGCSPKDLETLFQLIYLHFEGTRLDREAIRTWKAGMIERLRNESVDPNTVFDREFEALRTNDHPRARPLTVEEVEALDPEKALAYYRERFSNADDFTFFFVGNLDLDTMRPLAEKWLGSLPSTGRKDSKRIIEVPFPEGVHEIDVPKGREPKSRVRIAFGGDAEWSRETSTDARLLNEVLNIRLREILREDMGGVYGVSIWGGISREEPQTFSYEIQFGCAPDQVAPLRQAVFEVITEVQNEGVDQSYLDKVHESWKRNREIQEKQNGFWTGVLVSSYRWDEDPNESLKLQESLDRITNENLRDAAKQYLDLNRYIIGVLRPAED